MISVISIKDSQIKRLKALSTPKFGFHFATNRQKCWLLIGLWNLEKPVNLPKHQPLRNAISAGTTDFDGVLPIYEKTKDQFDMIMDSLKVEF